MDDVQDLLIKNLSWYMQALDLNDYGLSVQCHVPLDIVTKIFNKTGGITLSTLQKLAEGIGCKPADLLQDWGHD